MQLETLHSFYLKEPTVYTLMCVLSLCCGGVAADVRSDFAFLPLYGVRLVTDSMVSQIGY